MNIVGWTQISDYSSTELGVVSLEQAAEAVRSFPWDQRLHEFAERVLRKEDACAPGVGFNADDQSCFHVYAVAINEWQLYLSLTRPEKFLGLFRKPAKTLNAEVRTLDHAVELLQLFYNRQMKQLEAEVQKNPSREAVRPLLG